MIPVFSMFSAFSARSAVKIFCFCAQSLLCACCKGFTAEFAEVSQRSQSEHVGLCPVYSAARSCVARSPPLQSLSWVLSVLCGASRRALRLKIFHSPEIQIPLPAKRSGIRKRSDVRLSVKLFRALHGLHAFVFHFGHSALHVRFHGVCSAANWDHCMRIRCVRPHDVRLGRIGIR